MPLLLVPAVLAALLEFLLVVVIQYSAPLLLLVGVLAGLPHLLTPVQTVVLVVVVVEMALVEMVPVEVAIPQQ
jgi:hypothetical protein